MLAAGSLGTTLAQNVCKIITSSGDDITSELPSKKSITTWEEYSEYLHRLTPTDPTAENVAMMDIADNNNGKIEEVEHHDKPIILGLAVNKSIGKHWSLETSNNSCIFAEIFKSKGNGKGEGIGTGGRTATAYRK